MWSAVLGGLLIAVVIAVALGLVLGPAVPVSSLLATVCGIAGGAFFGGKRASRAGLYHGVLVGVGYVVFEGIGLVPTLFQPVADGFGETVSIIASDALVLGLAALFGRLASLRAVPWSSSDTDRGR